MYLNKELSYNLSNLSQKEKLTLGKYIYEYVENNEVWLNNRYWEKAKGLYWLEEAKSFLISYNKEGEISLKDSNYEIGDFLIKKTKEELTWQNREKFRNKWFKRKDSEEEASVKHIWNRKNLTTGEMELHINNIPVEQFLREFEWI